VLPFSCSCLVSSSPSEVWLFKFEIFPQVQLCSPLVVLLWEWLFAVLIYWDYHVGGWFICPGPFLWSRVSVPSAPPAAVSVLWYLAVCFSILKGSLTLGAAHWLRRWFLWSTTCPALGSGLWPACSSPFCLSGVCLLILCAEISSSMLPSSPVNFQLSHPLCCCTRLQFVVYFRLPRGCAGFSQGWLGEFSMMCGTHLFGL
jgi:hypothetical protein